jgi:hypothetical protein
VSYLSGTFFLAQNPTANGRIGYQFATAKKFKKARVWNSANSANSAKIQASNDGSTWVDVSATFNLLNENSGYVDVTLTTTDAYTYYAMQCLTFNNAGQLRVCEIQLFEQDAIITENSSAMTYIGLNNYASNTLLADSTWLNAICNSTYFESVLNAKVPTMTSATTPSGECFATIRPELAYRVFNGDEGTGSSSYWYMSTTDGTILGTYIGYMFTASNKVKLLKYLSKSMSGYVRKSCNFTLQGSNDNSTWTDIGNFSDAGTDSKQSFMFSSSATSYTYYRIVCKSANGNMTYNSSLNMILITELQFYGREDV